MHGVEGIYHDGRVELAAPVEWEDGVRVCVEPVANVGMTESHWPTTPEGIEALLRQFDSLEPAELTPEENAEWEAARNAVREVTLRAVRARMGLK